VTIKAIVTDIEGTTSSIDFVHQTLFPYAKKHLRDYIKANAQNPEVARQLEEVDRIESKLLSLDEAADVLERWIAEDRKLTPLKVLQGLIWEVGFEDRELEGHVYPDTPVALRAWHAQGLRLCVYSSASVKAQKLIFGHTAYGDLTPLFSDYFDTGVGAKRETAAYAEILRRIGFRGEEVLFLSDVGEELDAARGAGLKTCQLLRDERFPAHPHVASLADVKF
jgi:enolase-phosphatase E1